MYVPTEGPNNAKIFLVGEAPGETEDTLGRPFVGRAGKTLDMLLQQAGIFRGACLVGNVARERPPGNRIGYFFEDKSCTIPKPILKRWMEELKQEILLHRPNIVVALGRTALWALTGEEKITSFRGYITESTLVPGQKMLATFHPQNINHEWKNSFPAVMDLRKAAANSNSPDLPEDLRTLVPDATLREYIQYCDFLANVSEEEVPYIGLDIETSNPGCHVNRIGLGHNPNFALSIGILKGHYASFAERDELSLWQATARALVSRPVIVQNGSFDVGVIWNQNGILPPRIHMDTHIGGHVCWPEAPRSLGFLTSILLNVRAWKHTSTESPGIYNALDVVNMLGLVRPMERELEKFNLWPIYQHEIAQIYPATMLQLQGIRVDREVQEKLTCLKMEEMDEIKEKLDELLGTGINFRSHKQMQDLLYGKLGLPVQYKRRKSRNDPRVVTVNAEALQNLEKVSDNPVLGLILRYKRLSKLISDFLTPEISPQSRVHTSYNITGATMRRAQKGLVVDDEDSYKSFGRWSSSASIILPFGPGNLQNIPGEGRLIYGADEGHVIIQADYKQAEAVVVAYLINDNPAKTMFAESFGHSPEECKKRGWDIHKITASLMFGVPVLQVTKDMRKIGKTIRHAMNYSAGPKVVAARLGCQLKEAKIFLERYHMVVPQLRIWHQRIQEELRRTRTLTNLLGRRHRFLDRWGDELFRSAYSFIPQSTVGDLLNKSLVSLYNAPESRIWFHLLLQLHDAVYAQVPAGMEKEGMALMYKHMIHPLSTQYETFYVDVDFKIGNYWGDMQEVNDDGWRTHLELRQGPESLDGLSLSLPIH
jgi:uracil-DNA glycosylase